MIKQQALDYFVSRGWTLAQSAGIVANLVAESGLNPAAIGDGGAAYGIAQWHGDRQAGFQRQFGRPIQGSSLEDQLAWVNVELRTTEIAAGNALLACTTAAEAGACVSEMYERPGDRAGEAARRAALAQSLVPISGTTIPVTSTVTASGGNVTPENPPNTPAQTKGPTMGAALALLPLIAQFVPQIMTLIKPGSASTAKDAAVAQTVLNTVVQAAGVVSNGPATAQSVGAAVDAMNADPALAAKVQAAVVTHPDVIGLLEVGGGIVEARKANADPTQIPFYKNPGFVIACLLIPLIYIVVSRVMFGDGYSEQLKTVVVTAILSGLLGALTGFYFGSSLSSARKDDALAAR